MKQIRKAIIEKVPEIMSLTFGCQVETKHGIRKIHNTDDAGCIYIYDEPFIEACYTQEDIELRIVKIIGHPITLAHVLRAIDESQCQDELFKMYSNGAMELHQYNDKKELEMVSKAFWDLTQPLSGQSQAVRDLLREILC